MKKARKVKQFATRDEALAYAVKSAEWKKKRADRKDRSVRNKREFAAQMEKDKPEIVAKLTSTTNKLIGMNIPGFHAEIIGIWLWVWQDGNKRFSDKIDTMLLTKYNFRWCESREAYYRAGHPLRNVKGTNEKWQTLEKKHGYSRLAD